MIRPSKFSSVLDRLFPPQPYYAQLNPTQQQRLRIIWTSLAFFLAILVLLGLLLLTKNDAALPATPVLPTAPTLQNTTPGQTLELKAASKDFKTDPNLTVVGGTVSSDSNSIIVRLQVAGQILKNSADLVVYQVAFDTDQDSSTGFQFATTGVGAEYLADFDSKGNALLLHWLADEHRFETIAGGIDQTQPADNTIVFEVSRAALGFPGELNLVLLGADNQAKIQTFLPESGYVQYKLSPQGLAAAASVRSLWPLSINYSSTIQANSVELSQPVDSSLNPDYDIVNAKVTADTTTITATIQVAGKIETQPSNKAGAAFYQFLLDTDNSSKGNFVVNRLNLDAKYLADYDSNGFNSILHWLPKSTSFEGVSGLKTTVNANTLTFIVPLASIGNPTNLNFALLAQDNRLSQQNFLPDHSVATLAPPGSPLTASIVNPATDAAATDKPLQINSADLQVKDGFLNVTLNTNGPLDSSNQSKASYQLLLGNTITQTNVLTATTIISNNVIAPKLQVYYKLVYTPGVSMSQAQLLRWSEKSQSFENVQAVQAAAQAATIQLKIPTSVIGTGLVSYYIQTYDPADNFYTLSPQTEPGHILLSGSSHYILTPASVQVGPVVSPTLISQVDLQNTGTALAFVVNTTQPIAAQPIPVDYTALQFWIDSDNNPQTGVAGLHPALGVDYLLKYDTRVDAKQVQVYSYDSTSKGLLLAQTVPAQIGADNKQLKFELPAGLLNGDNFRLVIYTNAPAANLTQLLPTDGQSFAQISFQNPTNTQTLTKTATNRAGSAYLDLKQFDFKYDKFFVQGNFSLGALPKTGDTADYSINLTAYTPDSNAQATPTASPALLPTYYVINYDSQLDRAVLKRWSESNKAYELISQIDRILDVKNNILAVRLPYALLGQPMFVNYVTGVSSQAGTTSLPGSTNDASVKPGLAQTVATFYFQNPTTNSLSFSSSMKQNPVPSR